MKKRTVRSPAQSGMRYYIGPEKEATVKQPSTSADSPKKTVASSVSKQ